MKIKEIVKITGGKSSKTETTSRKGLGGLAVDDVEISLPSFSSNIINTHGQGRKEFIESVFRHPGLGIEIHGIIVEVA